MYADADYSDETYDELGETVQCYCDRLCPFGPGQGICDVTVPGGKCFASTVVEADEYGIEYPIRSYGCLADAEMAQLQCKGSLVPHLQSKSIICCDDEDFCNKNLYPDYTLNSLSIFTSLNPILTLICSFIISLVVLIIVVTIYFLKHHKKNKEQKDANDNLQLVETTGTSTAAEIERNGQEQNVESVVRQSSETVYGSEIPVMVQRTITRQLEMQHFVGKGQYGEVWLAKWRGEEVAVKLFFTTEESYWSRETEIYQTVLMRHENILGYIAADVKGTGALTQSILITAYHEKGSLFDYLQLNTLSLQSYLIMARCIASGLTHLHTEIFGTQSKPSIAHCDIRSKYILVKKNGECCIAHFGLAVKFDANTKEIDFPLTEKNVLNRYMAPEILDNTINLKTFESFKMTDIYSFALVLWEMTRKVKGGKTVLEYELPFEKYISNDSCLDEMREIVCVRKIRPEMPKFWKNSGTMEIVSKMISEMWHENPAVRLTALRVKKTLTKLIPEEVSITVQDT